MSGDRRRDVDEERRRVFRRMEWIFVYGPPIVAVLVAGGTGWLIAWLVRVSGTSFYGRWLIVTVLLLAIPAAGQLLLSRWRNRHRS